MKITAMLAWWDEPADELYACVRSMSVACDAVVAVDGAYEMTPGATLLSAPDQAEAIRQASKDADLDCTIVLPEKIWTGQVEKRNAMLERAVDGSDWVIAVDADHRLVGDRTQIRIELLRVRDEAESIRHDFYTPPPGDVRDLERLSPHPWHMKLAGKTIEHSLILRVLDDMRLERDHWGYSGVHNGQRVALGNWRAQNIPPGRYHRLATPFRVDHVCFARDLMRLDRNRVYCATRDAFKSSNGFEP